MMLVSSKEELNKFTRSSYISVSNIKFFPEKSYLSSCISRKCFTKKFSDDVVCHSLIFLHDFLSSLFSSSGALKMFHILEQGTLLGISGKTFCSKILSLPKRFR